MPQINKENILFGTLILAIITIPLENNWNTWAIVFFCIAAVIQQPLSESIIKLKKDRYWKLSAVYCLWLVATWFWDTTGGFSSKYIEANAIFLFVPIIMAIIPRLSSRKIIMACYAFIGAVVVVCIICLIKSTLEYQQTQDYRVFYYHYLGYQMGLNAIYLSNYCIACITWLLYYEFIYTGYKTFRISIISTIAICTFLFLMMFLLSSKFSLGLVLLLFLFMALYIGYKKKQLKIAFLALGIIGIASVILVRNLGYLNWRIAVTKVKAYSGPQDNQNGLAARITTWQSAIELIQERPVLGYGLKGANDALVKKYVEKDFQLGIPEKYNSHNQFLETTLKSGVIGGALLLSLLALLFSSAIKQNKFLLRLMLLHFILVSMVEATLEIQQELVFYWFFILLFYYHYPSGVSNSPYTEEWKRPSPRQHH